MKRIDKILAHDLYRKHIQENNTAEANRCFCRHNMVHFLDVARIGWILNLEEGLGLEREMVYAAALLHDIGKHYQYEEGIPHEQASAEIAPGILRDCGFSEAEIAELTEAIGAHRNSESAAAPGLKGVLYRADKASRACFACAVKDDCNWKDGKKNLQVRY